MSLLPLQLPNVDVDKIEQADSLSKATFASTINTIRHSSPSEIFDMFLGAAESIVFKIIAVVLVWYIGRWIIRKLNKGIINIFRKRRVDSSLQIFMTNLISISLTIILIYIVIGILGFNTSSFIALFASVGLAIGMALSGTLQNFAGGVMVLLLKPYRVGDYIQAQGESGTVKAIKLFSTIIVTPDNQTITIPNGSISTGIINNFSTEPLRRVEWVVGISYGDDFDVAKQTITDLIKKDSRILEEPSPLIEIQALADSSVNIVIRAWVKAADLWPVFFNLNEQMYKILPQKGINFPFPTMDLHINEKQ